MTERLELTDEALAEGYNYLCETNPFNRMALPPSDEVKFKVVKTKSWHSDCSKITRGKKDRRYLVRVSQAMCAHSVTVFACLSHEMIHIHQWEVGDTSNHNELFDKLKAEVCAIHGFDVRSF